MRERRERESRYIYVLPRLGANGKTESARGRERIGGEGERRSEAQGKMNAPSIPRVYRYVCTQLARGGREGVEMRYIHKRVEGPAAIFSPGSVSFALLVSPLENIIRTGRVDVATFQGFF